MAPLNRESRSSSPGRRTTPIPSSTCPDGIADPGESGALGRIEEIPQRQTVAENKVQVTVDQGRQHLVLVG